LTDRCKTTVPDTVRRVLRLGKRDKIHCSIRPNGEVLLPRAEGSQGDDPVLGQFLGFLARDMASHPERLRAVRAGLVQRLEQSIGNSNALFKPDRPLVNPTPPLDLVLAHPSTA
jgi:antitoxin PrlF